MLFDRPDSGSLTNYLSFRCTDRLADLVAGEAEKCGLSVSDYIRGCLWRAVGSGVIRHQISYTVIQESLEEIRND